MEKKKKERKYTTVQIRKDMRALLRKVARRNMRSMTKEIDWLVMQEAQRLGIEIEIAKDKKNGGL